MESELSEEIDAFSEGEAKIPVAAKRVFHVALLLGLVPPLSALVAFVSSLLIKRDERDAWRSRLRWLSLTDLVVTLAMALLAWNALHPKPPPRPAPRPAVTSVVSGAPVAHPVAPVPIVRPALFQTYEPVEATWSRSAGTTAKSLLVLVLSLGTLVVVARRRKHLEAGAPTLVAMAMTVSMLGSLFLLASLRSVDALSAGSSLLALVAAALAMLWLSVIALRAEPSPVVDPPSHGTLSTTLIGLFYLVASLVRIAIVIAAVVPYTREVGVSVDTVDLPSATRAAAGVVPLFMLANAFLTPLAEELLFRGVLLNWLQRFVPTTAAVLLGALAFAVCHISYGLGVVFIFAYGVILGWARIRSGKLYAPILLHVLINGVMCWLAAKRM